MIFDVYGRFKLEILREPSGRVAFRLSDGRRVRLNELAIPASLPVEEIGEYLDDLYHEMARPGQNVVRIDSLENGRK